MLLRKISFAEKVMEIFKKRVCFYTFMGELIDESSISTRMKVPDSFETQHDVNITRLVKQFGEEREEEIRKLYETEREHLEKMATMPDFVPLVLYNAVRQRIAETYR